MTARRGFADRASTSEVTEVDPPHRWSIRGLDGPIRAPVDTIIDQRSRLSITLNFEGHGVGQLTVPLVVVPNAREEMPTNLDQLQRQLEAGVR